MASKQVKAALESIKSRSDAGAKLQGYDELLTNITSASTPATITADFTAIADEIVAANLGATATKTAISHFTTALSRQINNDDLILEVGAHVLTTIINATPQSSTSLVEQGAELREAMATAHEGNEDFRDAAVILSEIPLDSTQRRVSDDVKAKIWIRVVRNYLEIDDSAMAETYLNKLKNVIHNFTDEHGNVTDKMLLLHFRLSQARINDAKREFLAAAQAYHGISDSDLVDGDDRLQSLSMAIKCAILAPAGPSRSQVLGRLYADERASGVEEYGILEKIYLERLLTSAEVDKFAKDLAPHQLAITSDGSTVLAKAVMEHNLLAVSRLYRNIGFESLAVLLGLDADKAEKATSRMIEQGRLVGWIDQIDETIFFESGEASGSKGSGRANLIAGREMRRWDRNVQGLAEQVEQVYEVLQKEMPQFVANNLFV